MAVTPNRKKEYGDIRFLLCLLLAVMVLSLLAGVGYCESDFQALNSSGNRNGKLSVDPINRSESFSAVLYDNKNGMPTSEANAIAQTGDGFIWIGSYAGLIRYDGNTFERITSTSEILNTRCLFVDSRERLWIGSNDCGVFFMTDGRFHKLESADELTSASIRDIAEDTEGVIYIGSAAGLSMVDAEMNLTVLKDDRIAEQTIQELRLGPDGLIYGLTSVGDLFTVKNGELVTFLSHEECRVADILSILPDPGHPGRLYLGTGDSRIYYGDLAGNFRSMGIKEIAPLSSVECMEYIDGQIWICAGNGIGKLNNEGFHQLKNIPMEKQIGHVMTDYEGNLWFTSTRQSVMKIVPNQFLDIFKQYDLPAEVVNSTCMYGRQLFMGTDSGLIVVENGEKVDSIPLIKAVTASGKALETDDLLEYLDGVRIRSVIRDSKDRLWISTWRQRGLIRYDHGEVMAFTREDGLLSGQIRMVSECEDGSILVAGAGGVSVIQGDTVTGGYSEKDGIVVMDILTVTEGFNHEVILGSDGSGIYVFSPDGNKHLTMKDGLNSEVILRIRRSRYQDIYWIITGNSIAYMTPDYQITTISHFPYSNNYDLIENSRGDIWVLSSNGIYVVSADEMLSNTQMDPVYYGSSSGLPCIATSNSYSELTPEGDLYIAGVTGSARVNIEKPFVNFSTLKIALPFIDADRVRYYPDESGCFVLPANARKLTVYPYVLNYSLIDPEVSYYLEGFDQTDTTVSRSKLGSVDYTNLRIGVYHFVVTVKDPVGRTEQTVSFRIAKGKEMSVSTVGSIIIDTTALFLMGGILIYTSLYRKRGRLEDRLFFGMILSNIALAVADGISYYLEGSAYPAAKGVMIAGNIIFFTMFTVFPYLFLLYLDYIAWQDKKRVRRTKLLAGIPCLLMVILLLLNLKTGWIFSFSQDNIYHSGPLNNLVFVPVAIYFLLCLLRLSKINVRLVFLGILLIVTRIALGIWFRGISSTAFTYTLFLVCTHIFVMNKPMDEVAL